MPQVRTYDAKRIAIIIGSHIVSGYAEDTFISMEPSGEGTVSKAGADGEIARSMSNNTLHRVTITLQATSPSNDYLSDLLARDRASGGAGVVPFSLTDLRGTTLVAASQAWVVNSPTVEYGAEVGEREWELDAVITDFFVGGAE